jgi:hypothetical protein
MGSTGGLQRMLGGLLASIALTSLSAASKPLAPGFALGGIRDGLKQSPEHYVAAVVEVVGAPKSQDPGDASSSVNDIRLVEVLSSRGGTFKSGAVLAWFGGGAVGAHYIAFLVPSKSWPGVYGASFMSVGATRKDRSTFADDLKSAGLELNGGGDR